MPPQLLYYALLVGCLLLALGLAWAAWRRAARPRRGARLLAGLAAAAGLWLTAYPPARTVPVPQAEAILLTDGYQPDTLRALLGRFGPDTRIFRYALNAPGPTLKDTFPVADLTTLREQLPALRRLHLLGRGLPAAALPALGPVRLVRHAPEPFVGFRAAHWKRQLELGQPLQLQGYFAAAAPAPGPVWVRLQVAGAPRDSVRLPAGQGAFRLRYLPKAAGRFVATLTAIQAAGRGRPLATEPVPAEVRPPRPLRVLLLAATPSFELKFLKNWLAARQHVVAWRVGISRGLTQTEFRNHPPTDLSRLMPALLARFDVLVAEAGVLATLAGPERQTLQAAQRATGLGIVVLAESGAQPASGPGRAAVRLVLQRGPAFQQPQRLTWPGAPVAAALVPATLTLTGAARPLVTLAGPGQVVVARQRVGAGHLVVSTLPETYSWLLQNAPAAYDSYWTCLLSAAARPAPTAVSWTIVDAWPRPQLPLPLRLMAPFPVRQPLVLDAAAVPLARLPLQQDAGLPEWSTATYWPTAPGWHQVQLADQPAQWFYVFPDSAWQGPEWQRRAQNMLPWLSLKTEPLPPLQHRKPWPAVWFFVLFLLAAGFLWLEEKL